MPRARWAPGGAPVALGRIGAAIGMPGFVAIVASAMVIGTPLFLAGIFATGLGAGLFGHATLTATIRAAPSGQIGLSLGAWGAVQATCAGIGIALAGLLRDVLVGFGFLDAFQPHTPYNVVFLIEIAFLALVILVAAPLAVNLRQGRAPPNSTDTNPNQVEVS